MTTLKINYPETPPGKRSIRRNVWGNVNGYVSGRHFWEFGCDMRSAEYWQAGASLEHAHLDCWLTPSKAGA